MPRFYNSGLVLQRYRLILKMTQKELGEKLDCNSQFVSNWERGLCLPTLPSFKKFQNLLNHSELLVFREDLVVSSKQDYENQFRSRFFTGRVKLKND